MACHSDSTESGWTEERERDIQRERKSSCRPPSQYSEWITACVSPSYQPIKTLTLRTHPSPLVVFYIN